MMKTHIKDGLQVLVAILLTTSMVAVNAATPPKTQSQPATIVTATKIKAPVPTKPVQVAVAAPVVAQVAVPVQTPVVAAPVASQPVYSGSHEDWMTAAGISPSDFASVDYIISHESGWNPDATEPNSGAHGLPQALPYSKTGCDWDDPICQLTWASNYAVSRYGSWSAAAAYWQNNHYW